MHPHKNVSVVIPLYNKRRYIRRSVESVLKQSHREFELIVIDDGSTDGSICELNAIQDNRVRIVTQENSGEGATRNRGVALASHRWIAFLDADDAWAPDFLSSIIDMIGKYPDAALCATGYYIQTPDGKNLVGNTGADMPGLHNNYYALAYQGKLPFCASSVAIQREALIAIGGFAENEPMGADQDLWCRLLTHRKFALNEYPRATYHEDAQNRVCLSSLPSSELPFSKRVQRGLDSGTIPKEQRRDAKRYIASHLLHLATLNLKARRWATVRALHADSRTRALPLKKYPKLLALYAHRLAGTYQ